MHARPIHDSKTYEHGLSVIVQYFYDLLFSSRPQEGYLCDPYPYFRVDFFFVYWMLSINFTLVKSSKFWNQSLFLALLMIIWPYFNKILNVFFLRIWSKLEKLSYSKISFFKIQFTVTHFKCDWISISLLSWCSTLDFINCDLNKTWNKENSVFHLTKKSRFSMETIKPSLPYHQYSVHLLFFYFVW